MTNERFDELLRRMPEIASAVNAFQSEALQKMAYQALLEAGGIVGEGEADLAAEALKEAATPSTQDILASVRARQAAEAEKPTPAAAVERFSAVESFKEESQYLRGEIGAELVDGTDHFGKSSIQLLKHHGTYQQDNRDARGKSESGKTRKSYMFMVRAKIPAGRLTSEQLMAQLDLGDEVGNGTLRITSRQSLQVHGVLKGDLKKLIRRVSDFQLTTLGACGDVQRNVMCCPAPYHSPVYQAIQNLADEISDHFAPRTPAYHELWLRDADGGPKELVSGGAASQDVEPIYGERYLPRKFKTAIGFPHDNCIDIYTQDLGLLAVVRDDEIVGYNVLVGGGMGVTPAAKKTFPAVAKRMAFVRPNQAVDVATAVVKVQRDFGNRSDRKVARMKYLIHNWGLERFKAKVEEYFGAKLANPEPDEVHGFNDHMSWERQGDGKWFYGLNIENGRVKDDEQIQLKSAIRQICHDFKPGIRLTSHQSILFTDLAEANKDGLIDILRRHHVPLSEETSTVRRWSMACVAWPTCGLSITESERALPTVMDQMEAELAKLGLSSEKFTVRMTGCPNGCARPYNADIGLVGKAQGKYTVFLGGRLLGNRLNFLYKDLVPEGEIVSTLAPVFAFYKQERQDGESLGDFCHRRGRADLLEWAENYQLAVAQ